MVALAKLAGIEAPADANLAALTPDETPMDFPPPDLPTLDDAPKANAVPKAGPKDDDTLPKF